jgi:uncharacterized lipoprotein YmbA
MRMMTMTIVTAIMLGGCASARDTMFYERPGVSEITKHAACAYRRAPRVPSRMRMESLR